MELVEIFNKVVRGPWVNGALDTQYRISEEDKDTIAITFMGSVSWVDWISNFMFWKVPYRDMKVKWYVHAGFFEAWKSVKEEIVPAVQGYKKIKIYGYSRGASIAAIAYEWFAFNGYPVEGVVFGCPRAFAFNKKSDFPKRFSSLLVINNKGDIVPHLPFKFFGYKDVGDIIILDAEQKRFPCAKWHLIPNYEDALRRYENS